MRSNHTTGHAAIDKALIKFKVETVTLLHVTEYFFHDGVPVMFYSLSSIQSLDTIS